MSNRKSGVQLFPQEVEQCLLNHTLIKEAAVIGIPNEKWGEKVIAFLTVSDEEKFDVSMKEYCKEFLGSYKIPKQFFILDELPKTDVGKIDKNKLTKSLVN